ncbi:two-component system, OmpR family, sensor histidine kinase CpxA [Abditibacterium utsteinense]|uniref:histidine kinase n=1 Tax=Abditibacterium utsteinense TaxID=1960156 RepID=A0A2S8SWD1_9BACT|nr:ATP-binding protein [Abditibacterium utsteinense]PQV65108.1 two-component system, OmpR family, sensor histidine kinase CpxA [Abditibacterium utsteinense]
MSLFLKIFLWFWGAMVIIILSLLAVQSTDQNKLGIPPRQDLMADALLDYGRIAVVIYANNGDAGLQKYLTNIDKKAQVKAFLFDPQGRELGQMPESRRAPLDVREMARKAVVGEGAQFGFSETLVMAAQPVITDRGVFVFAGAILRTSPLAVRYTRQTKLLLVASVFFITGLFCYGLAIYLAAPVGKIRRAAQRIAGGDLSARVQPNHFPRGHDEIAGLAEDFDAMAERLESLVAAQNRLLGDVSHELRSPLTRLNLSLELARRGDETKRLVAFDRIEREATRLEALIGELLTLSRLENGLRAENLNKIVDLSLLAREVAADADFEAHNAGRGVRVTFTGPQNGAVENGVKVRGDAELLRRALENIARNAARHTAENTVVEISLQPEKEQWILSARDHGPGVPEEELLAIFRPFYRVEGARERAETDRGTGLGLAIAERAASAHGGKISAKNAEDGGLIVEISLPVLK